MLDAVGGLVSLPVDPLLLLVRIPDVDAGGINFPTPGPLLSTAGVPDECFVRFNPPVDDPDESADDFRTAAEGGSSKDGATISPELNRLELRVKFRTVSRFST